MLQSTILGCLLATIVAAQASDNDFDLQPSASRSVSASRINSGAIPVQTFGQSGVNASSYVYVANGSITVPEPKPYTPAGGFGNNGSLPVYHPLSDFDFESLSLALYQEYIELDLFNYGLATFSDADFEAAGIDQNGRYLIQFMAEQEIGHATLISNILGVNAPAPCEYQYPFTDVHGFLDFCMRLTRWGESGVYGFLERLDSRSAAQLLLQSITTEARQQLIFRQLDGLMPMTDWLSCSQPGPRRLAWQNFPALNVTNGPSVVNGTNTTEVYNARYMPAENRTIPISFAGRNVTFSYEQPGKTVGPNNSYVTAPGTFLPPKYVAWVSQLNVTYSPFVSTGDRTGYTIQPNDTIWPASFGKSPLADNVKRLGSMNDPSAKEVLNGTLFVMLVDALTPALNLTSFNLSNINQHIVAGPQIYLAG